MFFITAIPVGLGVLVRKRNKQFADSFEKIGTRISTVLFIIIIIGALSE